MALSNTRAAKYQCSEDVLGHHICLPVETEIKNSDYLPIHYVSVKAIFAPVVRRV